MPLQASGVRPASPCDTVASAQGDIAACIDQLHQEVIAKVAARLSGEPDPPDRDAVAEFCDYVAGRRQSERDAEVMVRIAKDVCADGSGSASPNPLAVGDKP